MSVYDSKHISYEDLPFEEAKWTRLKKVNYTDPNGVKRDWEFAERTTRPENSTLDGVGVIAIIERPTGPEIMLQKQYRPPLARVTIEIPAGLMDAGETPEEAALRELKEETGYTGTVLFSAPVAYSDPGFCNTNQKTVHVKIDPNAPENLNPTQNLEDSEFIEIFFVPLKDLASEIERYEREGYAIDGRVGTLAEGIEVARRFRIV